MARNVARLTLWMLAGFGAWCAAGLTTLFVLYAPWRNQK